MLPEIVEAGGGSALGQAETEEHDAEAGEDHRDDGGDLEQRQPELHLAERLDVAQVQAAYQEDDA
ncbi:hypothetical protein D3C84_1257270 [compost metagenome]